MRGEGEREEKRGTSNVLLLRIDPLPLAEGSQRFRQKRRAVMLGNLLLAQRVINEGEICANEGNKEFSRIGKKER